MTSVIKYLRKPIVAVFLAIFLGFVVGAIVFAMSGFDPIQAYTSLFTGTLGRPRNIVQVLIRSTPIILTGLSVAFAFKTGLFNIGAEGQYIIGAVTAALVGYHLQLPPVIHTIIVILTAMFFAGAWGGFAGFLKAKFGIHEVITTIMLNWIALYLNNFVISLPAVKKPNTEASFEVLDSSRIVVLNAFKNSPEGREYLSSIDFLRETILRTNLNYGILIAIFACILVSFILNRTTRGFELRAVGENTDAAEFAGINVKKNIFLAMFISGAIAGLAGAIQILGTDPHRITVLAAHEGFGFDGISVALIAASNPIACIFSGLFFGILKFGALFIQSELSAPSEIINIVIGTIVFFIAMASMFDIFADKLEKIRDKKSSDGKTKTGGKKQ